MNVLFVSEFGPGLVETMTEDYISGLAALRPDMNGRFFHGFLRRYVEGGVRPVRVLNAMFMYFRLPFVLLAGNFDLIIVRTTPPGIQLWCALLGLITRTRVGTWFMDYHPEIEAQALARHAKFGMLVRIIRRIDGLLLNRMKFGIVLDEAMKRKIRSRASSLPLVLHPTWNGRHGLVHEEAPPVTDDLTRELRLVYAGNLGYSHPLDTLEALLVECVSLGEVRLVLVGVPAGGLERFRALARRVGLVLDVLPRTRFEDLGQVFHSRGVHAGLVVLSDESAGLVSPSKFGAYLRFGIATIYVGPPDTSSDAVCVAYGAGFATRNGATRAELRTLAVRLRDVQSMSEARENTRAAADYFRSKGGLTLATATRDLVFDDLPP